MEGLPNLCKGTAGPADIAIIGNRRGVGLWGDACRQETNCEGSCMEGGPPRQADRKPADSAIIGNSPPAWCTARFP